MNQLSGLTVAQKNNCGLTQLDPKPDLVRFLTDIKTKAWRHISQSVSIKIFQFQLSECSGQCNCTEVHQEWGTEQGQCDDCPLSRGHQILPRYWHCHWSCELIAPFWWAAISSQWGRKLEQVRFRKFLSCPSLLLMLYPRSQSQQWMGSHEAVDTVGPMTNTRASVPSI